MSQRVLDRPIRAMLAAAAGSALAAGVGGIGSRRAPVVYARLTKPRWAPPPSAFGPVWTVLYALMAIAAYRAWKADPARWRGLLVLHGGQLALNAAWPWTFFSARSRPGAVAVITALDCVVTAETIAVLRRDKVAAGLLVPYLIWDVFATALTIAVEDPAIVGPTAAPR